MVVTGLTAYLRGVEGRLREAELAHARAETRAAEERRRRRLTLALAASVLATVLIGVVIGFGAFRLLRDVISALRNRTNLALADDD